MAKDIPLGKITVDDSDVIAAAKSVDGLGASVSSLGDRQQKALNSANAVGNSFRNIGNSATRLGYILRNDLLRGIGDTIDGLQDVATLSGEALKGFEALSKKSPTLGRALGIGGAAIGGIFAGAGIYDATIGKLQGGNTAGNILNQTGQFIGAGFNQDQLRKNMQFELSQMRIKAENIAIDANNAVFDFKQGLQKNPEAINKAIGSIYDVIGTALGPAGSLISRKGEAAGEVATDQAAKAQGEKIAQALLEYTRRAGGIASAFSGLQAASGNFEARKSGAARGYQNALDFIAQETATKRIALAQQYNADTLKLDAQYYQQRAELARNYGVEAARAEEDHQRNIARMTKDHDKRMSRLADQRDALGLEDEIDAYQDQRQQADEDYQVQARRRSEDYANQLREMERAHQEQERERREAYAQQLVDLQTYAAQRRNQEAVEYGKLLRDIVQAFTDARNAFAAQMQTSNSTTNNKSAIVTQNFNGGGVVDANTIRQETYNAIAEVFAQ